MLLTFGTWTRAVQPVGGLTANEVEVSAAILQ